MSERHTPEPWDEFCDVCEPSTPNPESEPIVRISFANYKRARACVNACAGEDTKYLEYIVNQEKTTLRKIYDETCDTKQIYQRQLCETERQLEAITKQRDELLAALEDAVSVAKTAHEHWDNDQDSKVGKYLIALSGRLIGYDGRTDAVHKAITSVKGGA